VVLPVVIALLAADPDAGYTRSLARSAPRHCVRWSENTVIEWRANVDGNPETPGDTEFDAIRASFKTWNDAMAGCATVSFKEGPRTMNRKIGYLRSASEVDKNENIIVFRQKLCTDPPPAGAPLSDSCWNDEDDDDDCGSKYDCWDQQRAMVAVTLTTWEPGTGVLQDFDIEFNQPSFIFTTVDSPACVPPNYALTCVAWDLQNTMTHEIGHALGLDHSPSTDSTMFASAPVGETKKRIVDSVSREFTCDVYATGQKSSDCVLSPYDSKIGAPKGCGCSTGPLLLCVPLALLWRRRRVNQRAG